MLSRDTFVHVGAVLLAILVLAVAEYLDLLGETGPATVAVFLLFYGLVLGGAHLYLALRGEDGMVPVESRWRFLGMIAVLLGAGAVVIFAGDRTIGPVELRSVASAVTVVTVAAYFLTESVAGYRASQQG